MPKINSSYRCNVFDTIKEFLIYEDINISTGVKNIPREALSDSVGSLCI